MKENDLENCVLSDIRKNELYDKIENHDFSNSNEASTESTLFFEKIMKFRYQNSVSAILQALGEDLEIINVVNGSIKSIGMDSDRLHPDILARGIESGNYYIIELKISAGKAREAWTELTAYEEELLNHLPMLNRRSIYKIIISTAFPPLLQHAVTNALIRGDMVLCLKPVLDAGETQVNRYQIQPVFEWTALHYSQRSKRIFDGVTLCFYKEPKYSSRVEEQEAIRDVEFAAELFRETEGFYGGNGFCMAWKNHPEGNTADVTRTDFCLTLFTVNPYQISLEDSVRRTDVLSTYLAGIAREYDLYEYGGQIFDTALQDIIHIFSDKYSIASETCLDFPRYEAHLKGKYLFHLNAWGDIGLELRREYYHLKTWFGNRSFHHQDVFFKLLTLLYENYPFRAREGAGEAFQLGIYLGAIESLLSAHRQLTHEQLGKVRYLWNIIFCAMKRKYPDWNKPNTLCVKNRNLPNISRQIRDLKARLYLEREEYRPALDMGAAYAGFFWELEKFDFALPIPVEMEDLFADERFLGTPPPRKLTLYFREHFERLLQYCQYVKEIPPSALNLIWNISAQFGADSRGEALTPKSMEHAIRMGNIRIDYGRISGAEIMEDMRELLNLLDSKFPNQES